MSPDENCIVVYVAKPCGYCNSAIRYLKENKGQADIKVIDLTGDYPARRTLVEHSGQRTVPQIYIFGKHVGGFDDLVAKDRQGIIDDLLDPPM